MIHIRINATNANALQAQDNSAALEAAIRQLDYYCPKAHWPEVSVPLVLLALMALPDYAQREARGDDYHVHRHRNQRHDHPHTFRAQNDASVNASASVAYRFLPVDQTYDRWLNFHYR